MAHQTHVWAEEYDRDLGDTLGLQREIATAVARQIKLKLTAEEERKLIAGLPVSAEAHDAYLKGLYEWNKRTEEGFRSAIKYFEEVLQIQPDYAPAYAGLANSYNLIGQYGFARQAEVYPKAKVYAQRAVELDGTLAEAYTALADVEIKYDRDWRSGERDFVRAIQLNANYGTAHLWYAEDYLTFAGKIAEAVAEVKKAQEIEPLSPIVGTIVAETLFCRTRTTTRPFAMPSAFWKWNPRLFPHWRYWGRLTSRKACFPKQSLHSKRVSKFQIAPFAYGIEG